MAAVNLHLETDAAVNPARTQIGEDGAELRFAGGGVVVRTETMLPRAWYEVALGFVSGAHEAEAICLFRGMELARLKHHATALRARTDCLPLVRGLSGEDAVHSPRMAAALELVRAERAQFARFDLRWTPSTHAKSRPDGAPTADSLARKAAGLEGRSK
jgi:Reverse transcriptase-like